MPTTPLDAAAMSYAALLSDPCNGPLVHPIYPGADAGFLFRAENFLTWGSAPGDAAGIFHWTPGYPNFNNSELLLSASGSGGVGTELTANGNSPGKAFLSSQSRASRCVAACVKITYAGQESQRSGRIHYGQTNAGILDAAQVAAPDAVAQTLQHYTRTPTDSIELIWKPSQGDFEFCDPSTTSSPLLRDRKGALTVAWAGLPAGVGLTFHLTAVYEWTPAPGLGIGYNANGKARSRNSTDQVVDYLLDKGFSFVRHFGAGIGAGITGQVMRITQQAFGNMPATARQLNARRLT
jgi:hypothetical protein